MKHNRETVEPPRRTAASDHRIEALRNGGSRIEAEIADFLKCRNLRIAISPLGSSLKGYAAENSDIEYAISFLDGFQVGGTLANGVLPQDLRLGEQVYSIADRCLASLGLRPDSFGTGTLVHIFIYQGLLHSPTNSAEIFQYCNEATCPHWISRLLLPVAFGDAALLVQLKSRLFRSLEMLYAKDQTRFNSLWESIQAEHYNANWHIDESDIHEKPHLKAWLGLHQVDVQSHASFSRFLEQWRKQVGLPMFEKVWPAAAQLKIAENLGIL